MSVTTKELILEAVDNKLFNVLVVANNPELAIIFEAVILVATNWVTAKAPEVIVVATKLVIVAFVELTWPAVILLVYILLVARRSPVISTV